MAHHTLPVLSSPHFPQVLQAALNSFVTRIEAHPLFGQCDYEGIDFSCRELATVSHLHLEKEFCATHFRKVVGRG